MLVDGEIGPSQTLEARLSDERIRSLARRVTVRETPAMERLRALYEVGHPDGRFASVVTIRLRDGRGFNSGVVDGGLRFPQPGWDEARMDAKFRWMAGFVLDAARVDALSQMVWRFDQVEDGRELIALLLAPARAAG
jgi:2-methylcitrate dehydratase PrpD